MSYSMAYNIRIDDLLENNITNSIERVLWIDTLEHSCHSIETTTKKLKINIKSLSEIDKGFEDGIYTIISEDDSDKILKIDELRISRREKLEKRYNIVKVIDNDENIPSCFLRNGRGMFIKEAMERFNVPEKLVYQYLKKYWQGGSTIEALYDDYDNCGKSETKHYEKRPGRKSAAAKLMKDFNGVIVDDEVKKIFYQGYVRYYRNNPQRSLAQTFKNIKTDYYGGKAWYEKPTYEQFYNWYRNNIDKDKNEKDRKGKKNYRNNVEPLQSDSIYEANGPGFRYQVDSTIFPIYLVNRIDRSLVVGRPTVFFAVDVYSTRVTGIHISLHEESWEGYASLLYNTFVDKVKYCKMFGISISINDWNVEGLPAVVFGDRGGFISKNSDILIENLKVGFEFAPTFMGSAKGTVEKKFDIIENMIKHDLPGRVMAKYRERGEKNPRKYAELDIEEFTSIVIEAVLERNATIMNNYPLEKEIAWAKIAPSADNIWDWAMSQKKGVLRKSKENRLRYYLLRHGYASTTERGIKFKNMYYTCDLAQKEKWFSRINKSQKFEIAYDSRCMNTILLYDKSARQYIECEINRELTSNDVYIDRTLEEIDNYDESILIKKTTEYLDKNDETAAGHRENRERIRKEAGNKSKERGTVKVDKIDENRSIEKALYDEQQALTKNRYNKNGDKIHNEDNFPQNDGMLRKTSNSSKQRMAGFIRNKIINEFNK